VLCPGREDEESEGAVLWSPAELLEPDCSRAGDGSPDGSGEASASMEPTPASEWTPPADCSEAFAEGVEGYDPSPVQDEVWNTVTVNR